jgi:hypothetical protein
MRTHKERHEVCYVLVCMYSYVISHLSVVDIHIGVDYGLSNIEVACKHTHIRGHIYRRTHVVHICSSMRLSDIDVACKHTHI